MQKLLSIVGARPQFVKSSVVSRALRDSSVFEEVVLHTGQHFDRNMSDIFFRQLNLPKPNIQLGINGGLHGEMTGRMLIEIEKVLVEQRPDRILVYGDTNSTLAGALAAAKLHIPVAHIEAGLRSFNLTMPEEVNRILTDNMSDILFCPTKKSVENLTNEGFARKSVSILQVGDVMQDSALLFSKNALPPPGCDHDDFIVATLHRAENTDQPERLKGIVNALNEVHRTLVPVVLPLHPRTKKQIARQGLDLHVTAIDPVSYFEMLWLLKHAQLVLTDSGGVQKEAFFFGKACLTMRDETEWVELIDAGANELVGSDCERIIISVKRNIGRRVVDTAELYGGGHAASRIATALAKTQL